MAVERPEVELQHSLLSDKRILEQLAVGRIVIDPFTPENVRTSSVDVKLGEYYYRPVTDHGLSVYNPWSKKHVEAVFGKPHRAKLACEEFADGLPDGIFPEDRVIIAYPNQILLCHTEEFIGARNLITTMMHAKSGTGRNDLTACKCAGWGDVGYTNRWTMEVTAGGLGVGLPEILIVGETIAQIEFIEVGETIGDNYGKAGSYQASTDMQEIKASWEPSMMLPKLWKSRIAK